VREQEKALALPLEGSAGVMPKYAKAGRGVIVVRGEESSPHGEGPQEPGRESTLEEDTPALQRRIRVFDMQNRLAQKATEEPEHRFGGLYDLLTWEDVLNVAADRLLGNKGSRTPGLDGIQRDALKRNRDHHLKILQQQLREGTFKPMPVKRVYIPKKNGKKRPLGIPTLYDRWTQMAIKVILEPIFESDFVEFSHGFRPNRSCHTAVAHIYTLTIQPRRKVDWVIEGDIKGFFDHVHHQKLMTLLRERIQDHRLLTLIRNFVQAGVMEGELFKKTEEGTPQGGVISPLLANIYLNRFDHWFTEQAMLGDVHAREKNRKAGHANFMMVRFADDFVVFSNGTKQETEAFKAKMKEWLGEELQLELSEEKTAITHYTDGFDFLGFTIKKTIAQKRAAKGKEREVVVHYPSTESVERAIRTISNMTDRDTTIHSHGDQIEAVNAFLRGWGEYFRHSSAKKALRYVGSHAFMRMWKWLIAKDELRYGWRASKAKYYRNNTWEAGGKKLIILQSMKVDYPRYRKIGHPYLTVGDREAINAQLADPASWEPKHLDPYPPQWHGNREYGGGARGEGTEWQVARDEALQETNRTCAICGESENVEVHHIKARRQGGGHVPSNLIPLCRKCHRQAEKRNSEVRHKLREKANLVLESRVR
jgi:RNA-directed DNA polymerase